MRAATVRHAFITSLPVMAGYIVLGIGFGILLSAKGYSFWWAVLMSLTIFAGSMQYVGVDLLASGASVIATALMALMVNARHLFYGLSMIDRYRGMGWRKGYLIFGLTDETYSLVCANPTMPEGVDERQFLFLLTLLNQSYWVLGSCIGGLVGSAITFNTAGIDFSMTALFVSIFVEQWEKTRQHIPALWGVAVSVGCLLCFGADDFLIPSMVGISVGLLLMRRRLERTEPEVRDDV